MFGCLCRWWWFVIFGWRLFLLLYFYRIVRNIRLLSLFGYVPDTRTQIRLQIRWILFVLLDNVLIFPDNLCVTYFLLLFFHILFIFFINLPLDIRRELHPLCRQYRLCVIVILCRKQPLTLYNKLFV